MLDASPTTRLKPRWPYRRATFANRRVDDKVERDGLEMTFRGWTYSLQDYAMAFEQAGFDDRGDTQAPTFTSLRAVQPAGPGSQMSLMVRAAKR